MKIIPSYKSNIFFILMITILLGLTQYDGIGKAQKTSKVFNSEWQLLTIDHNPLYLKYHISFFENFIKPFFDKKFIIRQQQFSLVFENKKLLSYINVLIRKSINIRLFTADYISSKIISYPSEIDRDLNSICYTDANLVFKKNKPSSFS